MERSEETSYPIMLTLDYVNYFFAGGLTFTSGRLIIKSETFRINFHND